MDLPSAEDDGDGTERLSKPAILPDEPGGPEGVACVEEPREDACPPDVLEFAEILDQHRLWLDSKEAAGTRGDLSGMNLARRDLTAVNLQGAQLNKTILRGADLSMANLRGANLVEADLREGRHRRRAGIRRGRDQESEKVESRRGHTHHHTDTPRS